MNEESRRKYFIKSARAIIRIWPEYALKRPAPKNETERYTEEYLKTSQDALIATWTACRRGESTGQNFEKAVDLWWVERVRAARTFLII